jgi:hypothetical protein
MEIGGLWQRKNLKKFIKAPRRQMILQTVERPTHFAAVVVPSEGLCSLEAVVQEDIDEDEAAVGGQDREVALGDWVSGQAQNFGVLV